MTGRSVWISVLLSLGGIAWGLCFGVETRAWLACFALAPLILLLQRHRCLLWAWLFAFLSWLVATPWIATTLASFGGMPPLLAQVLGVLLAIYLAADILLFAWLGGKILKRQDSSAWWALPALWVIVEALRGLPFGGFPWNLAAYAWVDLPGALLLSSWIGATGVSFLVVAVNVAAALSIQRRRWRLGLAVWLAVALLLSFAARFAAPGDSSPSHSSWTPAGKAVRLVQPNTGVVLDPERAWQDYEALVEHSLRACDEPALVIWPESAAWPHSWFGSKRLQADVAAIIDRGCPVILSTAIKTPEGVLNASLLIDEVGVGKPYAKRQLVPFGEYVPLGDVFPFIGNLARQAGDFLPGRDPTLLHWREERLGMAICYEVVFASPVAEQVREGATILTTVTNDAWYGDSSAPHQHLRAAQFRAAENRRPMLRAALTGISAVIDVEGRVVESLGVSTTRESAGTIRARVAGRNDLTFFSRAPWLSLALASLLVLFAIIPAALPSRWFRKRPIR